MSVKKMEPLKTLHIRNFPESLRWKCRAVAALQKETLEKFVKRVLEEATKEPEISKSKHRP